MNEEDLNRKCRIKLCNREYSFVIQNIEQGEEMGMME
jgi:hypothetical protein